MSAVHTCSSPEYWLYLLSYSAFSSIRLCFPYLEQSQRILTTLQSSDYKLDLFVVNIFLLVSLVVMKSLKKFAEHSILNFSVLIIG